MLMFMNTSFQANMDQLRSKMTKYYFEWISTANLPKIQGPLLLLSFIVFLSISCIWLHITCLSNMYLFSKSTVMVLGR